MKYKGVPMFKNYLKIAIRNLWNQKSFTFINIVGLSLGMTCFILILMYVKFEVSYEAFHQNNDRIYRVAIERIYPDKTRLWGRTAFPVAQTFQNEFPEVLHGTRILANTNFNALISYGDKHIYDNSAFFADPNFFDVFSIPLIQGDPGTALCDQNAVVITEETARRFFGDEDAMGRTLTINNADYTVTGVSENVPKNSHFHYNFLLSLITLPVYNGQQWINAWGAFTYILLHENCDAKKFEAKFPKMVEKYMAPEVVDEVQISFKEFVAAGNGYRFFLQPLKDIHLKSKLDQEIEANGNIMYVYLFSGISIFVLIIACINFMNLTTARFANRAKEVGIRKAVGSTRIQLILQFLTESTLLSGLALIIAMGVALSSLTAFNNLTGTELDFTVFDRGFLLPGIIGLVCVVGLLAGSYPAFFLSSFRPVTVLKGSLGRGSKNSYLRNALVVFQFAISIILIASTLVISQQIEFMLNKDLGFDKEHVVVIRNTGVLDQQVEAFKQELLKRSDVIHVSGSAGLPGGALDGNVHRLEGTSDDRAVSMSMIVADYDYVETMGMKIIAGRNFSRDFGTEQDRYVLNETAVKILGLSEPVGARITDHFRTYTVIGVLKDFHFKPLHTEISPVIYALNPRPFANFISVRIRPEDISGTLSGIEKSWHSFTGERPFEYSFLDDDLAAQYAAEQKTRQISAIFSGIAILIGCLGLFGLAAFTAEQRTKEIGVRKVLGASTSHIMSLLIREFTKLVAIAFIVGTPLAYLAMQRWLKNFAYSVNLSINPFILSGLLALGIALLTVSFQAVKAALQNPLESLRYE